MKIGAALLAGTVALAALVAACEGCKPSSTGKPALTGTATAPTGRLVLMSDLAAALEPCGCVADQRGGLARLGAFAGGQTFPVVLGAAGPTFFDDVQLNASHAAQELEKAHTVAQVFAQQPVFLAPSRSEFAAGSDELAKLVAESKAGIVSRSVRVAGQPLGEPRLVSVGATKVAFIGYSGAPHDTLVPPLEGLSFDANVTSLQGDVAAAQAAGARFVVLLASASRGEALRLVDRTSGIDLVLVGAPSVRGEVVRDDVPIDRIEKTVVVEPASRLQSVVVVDLVDRGGPFEEGDLAVASGSRFVVRQEPVASKLAKSPESARILAAYDARIDAQNRVRYASRTPAPPREGEAHYVGVGVCGGCHAQPLAVWSATRHAKAYPSLTEKHKAFDLDCVGCHVTGYEKPGGSTVTHVGNLENVQCEACHGPGSKHVAGGGLKSAIVRKPDPSVCTGCHHEPHVERSWRVEQAWPKVLGPGHGAHPG